MGQIHETAEHKRFWVPAARLFLAGSALLKLTGCGDAPVITQPEISITSTTGTTVPEGSGAEHDVGPVYSDGVPPGGNTN